MREVNGFYSKEETARRPNASSHVEFITFLTDDMGASISLPQHKAPNFQTLSFVKKNLIGSFI